MKTQLFFKSIILIPLMLLVSVNLQAQCPKVDIIISDTLCINENIDIKNNSSDALRYEWDFCLSDILQLPTKNIIIESDQINRISSIDLVQQNGIWYGFAVNDTNGNIIRLVFESGLDNEPEIDDLGNFGIFQRPRDIDIIYDGQDWLAIVVDFESSSLGLLNFENTLENDPISTDLGGFSTLNKPVSLEIENDNGSWVGVVSNVEGRGFTILNWGSSISSNFNPQIINRTKPTFPRFYGVDIIRANNKWYGLTCSIDTKIIYRLDFGGSLFSSPSIIQLNKVNQTPSAVGLVKENSKYFGIVSSFGGELYRFSFGSDLESTPTYQEVSNNINFINRINFDLIRNKGGIHLISSDLNNNIVDKLTFRENCNVEKQYSETINPEINYRSNGQKNIRVALIGSECTIDSTFSVYIKEDIAPSIDLQAGDVCKGSTTQLAFTTENPNNIISQIWTVENTTFTGESINYNFPSSGTYPVTLEVESADGCGQRVTQDITIYEPPEPRFTVDQEVICTNGAVAFQNLTNTQGADSIISYSWNFNGEGTSTEANPSFTFSSAGSKTVNLTASIPGCANTYDTTFVIEQGPVVDFSTPPQICQGEAITFENLTSGADITGYQWNFGEGGSYSSTSLDNPVYTYDTAGVFIAMLEVSNVLGCATTLSKTLTVYATPEADFLSDVACAGAPTQFSDESTTGINSNVIAWDWDFGDGGSATSRNPQYVYEMPGLYEVRLSITTSAGCTDTFVQEILVESPVTAGIEAQPLCPDSAGGYTVQFNDASSVSGDEVISEWLWTINGENFVIANPTYTFDAPGTYAVSLTVFAESSCNAFVSQSITIAAPPEPAFSYALNCAGVPITFTNQTVDDGATVIAYEWTFSQEGTVVASSFDENPNQVFEDAGLYTAQLSVTTSEGCTYQSTQDIAVPANPEAAFVADRNYGGAPLTVNFTNQSSEANAYVWDIDGQESSTDENPSFTFEVPGTYTVSLTSTHDLGCTSTFSETIEVVVPVTDLALQSVSLLSDPDDENIRLLLTMRNLGTLPLQNFPISLTIDELISIEERYEDVLEPGGQISYPLDFSISGQLNRQNQLRYVCATLSAADDRQPSNNRVCINLRNELSVIAPFPNPTSDQFELSVVLPQQDNVLLELLSSTGEVVRSVSNDDTNSGLNLFSIDVTGLSVGSYLLRVSYRDNTEVFRLMISP